MNLKKARRKTIRIDGEPVATLDFSSMFARLAYADLGVAPPEGDIYAIEGLEHHRSAVKLAVNCLLFDDFVRTAWPNVLTDWEAEEGLREEAKLPEGWGVAKTKKAIIAQHPRLKGVFGRGKGYQLMHTESVILMKVLSDLRERDIVGLGLHDGLLVGRRHAAITKEIMEQRAIDTTGVQLKVTVEME